MSLCICIHWLVRATKDGLCLVGSSPLPGFVSWYSVRRISIYVCINHVDADDDD